MKIISWNVNGIVSCRRKGLLRFLADTKPDILCCQEIKTQTPLNTPGYLQFWNPAKKPGYSGTLVLARRQPLSWSAGMGVEALDEEGRLITLEYPDFYLLNVYSPSIHPHSGPERPSYRAVWDKALCEYICQLKKPVVAAGDFNVTRTYIDSYPENENNSQEKPFFLPEIREAFEDLLETGLVDVFRAFYPNKEGSYTWWGPKNKNRAENKGSRLDYILVSEELLQRVQNIKFHTNILASDHCPISMQIHTMAKNKDLSTEDMAIMWQSIDWPKMETVLMDLQEQLALAADIRDWKQVKELQQKLIHSWAAKVLAVRSVVNTNSEAGVDGVRWRTDAEKISAALSLNVRGYTPLPYRVTEIKEKGKQRIIHVPVYRDKSMLVLCAYALDPVAEATADKKSFFARRGRSSLDLHAFLEETLSGGDTAPTWAGIFDLKSYYSTILHTWILKNIPMCQELSDLVRKLLKAGIVKDGELFDTSRGISLGTSLSPILGNMVLDGLQSYIYDRLYPDGGVDYAGGGLYRFADDILVTARNREQVEQIKQIVEEFAAARGLRLNEEKTKIRSLRMGFSFLSRHYKMKDNLLTITPSNESVARFEHNLAHFIENFHGSQKTMIEKINKKLSGFASYHRSEDAYMEFRYLDAVTELLLVNKMCAKYPRWHRETILNRFWIKDGDHYVFIQPGDPSVRVIRLAPLETVKHKPCRLDFNPYLDQDYYQWLQGRRAEQKTRGKYRAVWERQEGCCAYCGQPMLADQEVEIVEQVLGRGRSVRNLMYIHRYCAYNNNTKQRVLNRIDYADLLEEMTDQAPERESPYWELTEYFRLCENTPVSLTFEQIETILGEPLDWEARLFDAFWYDDMPGRENPMWIAENYPFETIQSPERIYCIAHSWLSQGYAIKALHRSEGRVVFRRTENYKSGLRIPKQLIAQKLPDSVVRECNNFFGYIIKKYGL